MFHVIRAFEDCELLKLVFVFRILSGYLVDLRERWLLLFQIVKKALNAAFFSFNNNFYNSVPSIPHVADQPIFYGDPIDERSKTYSLNEMPLTLISARND